MTAYIDALKKSAFDLPIIRMNHFKWNKKNSRIFFQIFQIRNLQSNHNHNRHDPAYRIGDTIRNLLMNFSYHVSKWKLMILRWVKVTLVRLRKTECKWYRAICKKHLNLHNHVCVNRKNSHCTFSIYIKLCEATQSMAVNKF